MLASSFRPCPTDERGGPRVENPLRPWKLSKKEARSTKERNFQLTADSLRRRQSFPVSELLSGTSLPAVVGASGRASMQIAPRAFAEVEKNQIVSVSSVEPVFWKALDPEDISGRILIPGKHLRHLCLFLKELCSAANL